MERRRRIILIAWSVTLAALGWFLYDLRGEWLGVGEALSRVHLGWVALASVILLGEFFLRALRWKVLLRPLGTHAKVRDMFDAQVIGAAVNTLLPLRAGELAKTLVASRRTGESLVAVVATAVMERVYDLFGLICVLLLMVLALPNLAASENELVHNLKLYGGLFGLFALGCMAIFFLLATRRESARRTFERILSLAPKPARGPFLSLFDGFVSGLGNARDFKGLLQAGLLSILMWLNGALAIWCLFEAFEMDMAHPFGAACFTGVAIALTVAVPQAPGFVGVFHVAMQKTMLLWGQGDSDAAGFAIVFWAVSFIPVTTVGLWRLYREGIALKEITGKTTPKSGQGASRRRLALGVVIGLPITAFVIRGWVWTPYSVGNDAMVPTLYQEDVVGVSRTLPPRIGDVIAFVPQGESLPSFQRVIAIGPAQVEVGSTGDLYVDGQILSSVPATTEGTLPSCENETRAIEFENLGGKLFGVVRSGGVPEITTLSEGELYLIGDNRPDSSDSRHLGPIARDRILGVVTRIVWPTSQCTTGFDWTRWWLPIH